MFKSLFAVVCSALLINNVFGATNGNNVCQLNNPDIDVNTQFNLCLDGKYYQCYEKSNGNNNNKANTSTLNVSTSGSSKNNNNNNNLFSINYYNLNNLLKQADCYHVSNNCRKNQRFIVLECSSNYSTANITLSSSGSSSNSSSSNDCVLTSSTTSNNNSTELRCKILFNLTKKSYIYAFIAVIVLILVLFCLLPICCVYYFCRYHNGSKMMEHNSMFNRYNKKNKNQKCEKQEQEQEKEYEKKNKYNTTTMGGNTTNNNYDGDMTYENENNENNALCTKKKMTFCMATTEQEIETQPIYNTSSHECNNEKDGTNTRDEVVV